MAYQYLNEHTNDLFAEMARTKNYIAQNGMFNAAMMYYDKVLCQPKFKMQRHIFQAKLVDYNLGFFVGYFQKSKKSSIDAYAWNKMQEFIKKHSLHNPLNQKTTQNEKV